MTLKTHTIWISLSLFFLIAQNNDLELDVNSQNKSLQGAFGAVTIDGKIWNQLALRPTLPFGNLSVMRFVTSQQKSRDNVTTR